MITSQVAQPQLLVVLVSKRVYHLAPCRSVEEVVELEASVDTSRRLERKIRKSLLIDTIAFISCYPA